MIQKEITQTADGVNIRLSGDIAKTKIEAMASNCNSGGTCSCECNNDLKDRIKQVNVSGTDGDVTLSLKGETLKADQVIEAMGECDMEKYL
jgi:hypothetical protein